MFPAAGNSGENRYIDILVAALQRKGHRILPWNKHLSLQSAEVFHVHWPELIAEIGNRPGQWLRGWWMLQNFRRTLERIRRRGGRVVWTVHNLAPHNEAVARSRLYQQSMQFLLPRVDVVLSLTEAGIPEIRRAFPALSSVRIAVARHPHFRSVLCKASASRARIAADHGIPQGKRVAAFLGGMRSDKQVELLAQSFAKIPHDDWHLLLAGAVSAHGFKSLQKDLGGVLDWTIIPRPLSPQELADLHELADVIIFPADAYFNSATIYTALSFSRMVVAQDTPMNREIQREVGANWVWLFSGKLSGVELQRILRSLPKVKCSRTCHLDGFDPGSCAAAHLVAYSA